MAPSFINVDNNDDVPSQQDSRFNAAKNLAKKKHRNKWVQDKNISRKSYNCLIREIYNKFLLQNGVSYKRVYDCFLVLKHLLVESHFKDKRITYNYLLFIFTFVTTDKLNRTGFNA